MPRLSEDDPISLRILADRLNDLEDIVIIAGSVSEVATQLAVPRQIKLAGDVQGSAYFDGSKDISIDATIIDEKTLKPAVDLPYPNTEVPSIGISEKYAREDHSHPLQENIPGVAAKAKKLETPFSINLIGDVNGEATLDGSKNINIETEIVSGSHTHDLSEIVGLGNNLNGKANVEHGRHVEFSVLEPSAPNEIADPGSAVTVARSDHVHPLQINVSGSSGSCTGTAENAKMLDGIDAKYYAKIIISSSPPTDTSYFWLDTNTRTLNYWSGTYWNGIRGVYN